MKREFVVQSSKSPTAIADSLRQLVTSETRLGPPNLSGYYPIAAGVAQQDAFSIHIVRRLDGRMQPRSGLGVGADGVIEPQGGTTRVAIRMRDAVPSLWFYIVIGLFLAAFGLVVAAAALSRGGQGAVFGAIVGGAAIAGGIALIALMRQYALNEADMLETALRRLLG